MPLYEYLCEECKSEIELLIRGEETPQCSSCGSSKLAKQWSVPAAHTAGSRLPIMGPCGGGSCGLPQCGQSGCDG